MYISRSKAIVRPVGLTTGVLHDTPFFEGILLSSDLVMYCNYMMFPTICEIKTLRHSSNTLKMIVIDKRMYK